MKNIHGYFNLPSKAWLKGYLCLVLVIATCLQKVQALNILLPGGSGPLGKAVAARLPSDKVTILSRNVFLASAPNRVTGEWGWVGERFLADNPQVRMRDWDGGDLLDIVGKDWMGWQEDALIGADVVVHLYSGYTEQRIMACERIVRESLKRNPNALQVTVGMVDEELTGLIKMKKERLQACEEMVMANCLHSKCIRLEDNGLDEGAEKIVDIIREWTAASESSP